MSKIEAIATVILVTILLAVALISQADAKVQGVPIKGGTYKTMTVSQWQLHKYKSVTLPKRYPFKYAPWRSYVLIDKYVRVDADLKHNLLVIDPQLYAEIKPEADANRATAKRILRKYKVNGKETT